MSSTVLLSTQKHMFKLVDKKISAILHRFFRCLTGPMYGNSNLSLKTAKGKFYPIGTDICGERVGLVAD